MYKAAIRWHWAFRNSRCTNLAGVSLSRSKTLSNPGRATFVPVFDYPIVTVLSSSRTDSTGGKRQSRLPTVGRRLRRVYTTGNRDRGFQGRQSATGIRLIIVQVTGA
jgi:hypothetical protein